MNAAVSVQGISKRYELGGRSASLRESLTGLARAWRRPRPAPETLWALRDVSFEVPEGQAFAIIGRNGAGKSTLLKLLSRITAPTAGRIELRGRVASLLEVGTGFHPELTGRENIFLNGTILGMSRAEVRGKLDEIVAFSGVERFLDTPVKHYSTGMYVRLAFSVAAHIEPEILIIDEVLAVGDAEFQRRCLGKMENVAGSGRTVLFVSHNLQAVETLCPTAILLEGGKLVAQGPTSSVVARYIAGGSLGGLERVWSEETPQGEHQLWVRAVRVEPRFQEGEEPVINVTTPLDVVIDFTSRGEVPVHLNLSLHLLTMNGECVFNVGSDPVTAGRGSYRAICHIPGDLLNNGIFHIDLMLVRDTTTPLQTLERAVTFEVADKRENSLYFGKWPGYVRPRLSFPVRTLSP